MPNSAQHIEKLFTIKKYKRKDTNWASEKILTEHLKIHNQQAELNDES